MKYDWLHMICGNCGCDDMFRFNVVNVNREKDKYGDLEYITCENCSTVFFPHHADNATAKEVDK